MLRFTVNSLDGISGIPLLGSLIQPFDRMDLWLSDDFMAADIQMGNRNVYPDDPLPQVYPDAQNASQPGGADDSVLLAAGCHFLVVNEVDGSATVVLDYDFQDKPAPASGPSLYQIPSSGLAVPDFIIALPTADDDDDGDANNEKSAPFTITIGPLPV